MKVKYLKIRKIEKAAFLFIAVMASFSVQAQDTTSFKEIKDERVIDSLENLLLEGEYGTGVSANFTFSKFVFNKKTSNEETPNGNILNVKTPNLDVEIARKNKMHVHGSGVFLGFSNLASRNLSNIGDVDGAILNYSSSEIGWTIGGMDVRLSKKQGWILFAGVGFRVNMYRSDLNTAFRMMGNRTEQIPAANDIFYTKSNLTQWYIHIPIMLEYQKEIRSTSVFFQAGAECGVKLSSKSKVKYRSMDSNKKIKEIVGKGMNVNPFTIDLKAEIGFDNLAIYARYGLIDIFRKGRGAEAIPVSVGIIYHF